MSITALDKVTVKKITTAQVVTSVLSAVKELFENTLDAGANSIDVILEDQGLSYIEVRDNAKGISEADSLLMALPAYTSKLSGFNDLESLDTYGFRGEALSALCRVSDVKIMTRTEKDDAARCYTMNHNGNIEHTELCARSIGTTVQVFSLLKNIPVRRKIISNKKRASQDVEEIELLLKDFGICHPHIRINYRVDDVNRFIKLPAESVKESLTNIFSKKLISNYEFLNFHDSNMNIELIIPKKDLVDVSPVCQKAYSHIYINRRPVLYKEFEKNIITLLSKYFGEKIPAKKKPIFFLMIKVPSSDVDVNLEPNKTKVLLKNVSELLEIVAKLLSDYYGILKTDEIVQEKAPAVKEESLIEFMDDSGSDDERINKKTHKKRKIENSKGEATPNKIKRLSTENKENEKNAARKLNLTQSEEETLTQLPKVDLGPDFSTQEIEKIPTLDPEGVQDVIDKLEHAMTQPKTTNVPTTSDTLIQVTELQWSKGHVKDLKGGTDVAVLGPSSGSTTKQKSKIHDSDSNPSTRGFLKFSEKMGPQLKEEIPGVDFVTMATSIARKWKQLAPEEREHYREIGRQEILENSQKLNVSGGKKRSSKITPEDMENNKKRMQNMIQKMEHLNPSGDNWQTKNTNQYTTKIKNVRNWEVNKKQLIISCREKLQKKKKYSLIIGPLVDNNIWTVSTNSQIWALNLNQLFDTLNLEESKREQAKGNRELVETYFKRAFNETDDMNFMHPIDFE